MKKEIYLMHKDIEVAKCVYDDYNHTFSNCQVLNQKHMPIGTHKPRVDGINGSLRRWQQNRCIPNERPNLERLKQKLNITEAMDMLSTTYMCSLTDCYWFKPVGENICWDDVNFFKNGFESNIGYMLMVNDFNIDVKGLHSPDITTNGALPKMWAQDQYENKHLIKTGSKPFKNQPPISHENVSEVFASNVMELYDIPAVKYYFTSIYGQDCCICPNFIENDNMEFVSMYNIMQDFNGSKQLAYKHLVDLGFEKELETIRGIDFLLGNGDRHESNIGYIRDSNTCEIIGLCPVFDTGACMPYDYINNKVIKDAGAKLYKQQNAIDELSQLKNFDWFKNCQDEFSIDDLCELYHITAKTHSIPEDIITQVCNELKSRYHMLEKCIERTSIEQNYQNINEQGEER